MHPTRLQSLLPQRFLCEMAGALADSSNPLIARPVIGIFQRAFGIDLSECVLTNPRDYHSFNDFFVRRLRIDARPVADQSGTLVSPVDGAFACVGAIEQGRLLQAKGRDYRLDELLVDGQMSQAYEEGQFATLYLAPFNYHRVHVPLESKVLSMRYVPGRQFSVNRVSSRHIPNIYARNERLIVEFASPWGNFCLVMVGALLVAGISTVLTGRLKRSRDAQQIALSSTSVSFPRGAEFGAFHMGSTVILLFPPGMVSRWHDNAREGSPVQFGEMIADLRAG